MKTFAWILAIMLGIILFMILFPSSGSILILISCIILFSAYVCKKLTRYPYPEFVSEENPDLDDEDQYDRILHQTLNERGIVEDDYEWRD
jgi:hypothetical protein